jgi:hypothetical protein
LVAIVTASLANGTYDQIPVAEYVPLLELRAKSTCPAAWAVVTVSDVFVVPETMAELPKVPLATWRSL